jgi:hypothetical protein
VPAVVVGAAGGEQPAPLGQAGQGPAQLVVVLGVPDLDPIDPRLKGLAEHPVALAGGEPAGVGEHGHPGRLGRQRHRVVHRDAGGRHIRRAPRGQVAVEGLGHVGHGALGHHRPGEVGPGQDAAGGGLDGVGVPDPTEPLQPLPDGQVALVPAPPGHLDGVGQVRLQQPLAVQQHVHHPVADGGRELAAGQHLDPEALPGRPGLGHRGHGVVVGDGQGPDPGRGGGRGQLGGPVAAVAGQGVGVQVDHRVSGRPGW